MDFHFKWGVVQLVIMLQIAFECLLSTSFMNLENNMFCICSILLIIKKDINCDNVDLIFDMNNWIVYGMIKFCNYGTCFYLILP